MRNLAAKVPVDLWPEFKARVTACYQAPSRAIARDLAAGIRADYAATVPSAKLLFLPGVGHMPHHAAPDAIIAAIEELVPARVGHRHAQAA